MTSIMWHEQLGNYSDLPVDPSGAYQGVEGRYQAPAEEFYDPLISTDFSWDPAEELAFMLRDAVEQHAKIPAARNEDDFASPEPANPREALVDLTAQLPPVKAPPRGHRKVRDPQSPNRIRTASYFIAALATAIASAVSIFGGLTAYNPLLYVAVSRTQSSFISWWPLLVFGPWLVASLSILRTALHQRRALHSWAVLLIFSAIAMALCVAQAPRNVISIAAAALPSFASLACFQQVVRQITLTRPPRRTLPRHRLRLPETSPEEATDSRPPKADQGRS